VSASSKAAVDRHLDRVRREHDRHLARVAVLAHELLVNELDDDRRRGAPLEHLTHVGTDQVEGVEPFLLHLERKDLDRHAEERLG
jgi:hypothetical protein